ncbi:MAG: tetratricopeptide repeat protein [Taibaiella sp.]|nr:tetratricopeptide repeat protein [Taibaiella sp.]
MNYILIGAAIIAALVVYVVVATANNKKKAPEKLANARKLFKSGNSNSALKELAKAFVIPINEKITPEYKVHLLGVLNLLKEILDDMNIASNTLLDKIFKRLNEAHGTIELQEDLYKPVQDFFEHTESDEKLVGYLKQAVLSRSVNVVDDEAEGEPGNSSATMEVVNRAGKFILKGQPQQAIDIYNEALTKNWATSDEAFLYDQLGSCHLMNNDLAAAETHYRKSIATIPYFQNVWNYTDFLVYHKRKADAEKQLQTLATLVKTKSNQKEYEKVAKKLQEIG